VSCAGGRMLFCMRTHVVANSLGILLVLGCVAGVAQTAAPKVFLMSPEVLAAQKAKPDAELLALARREADSAMKVPAQSVTVKTKTPPSGDKHDYMSMARYWWPNPDTPNHLPYVRHDGKSNPEIAGIKDHEELTLTNESARALALGWYLTGEEKYAEHAAMLLRSFYLDKATAMNPNLNYAQYISGVNDGRGAGVLDARSLAMAVDAMGILAGSKSWTAEDQAGMQKWMSDYYTWLETSKNGKDEKRAPNNHGSWFAQQETSVAMFLGKTDEVKKIAVFVREQRIPSQFDEKGMQKYELVRTNSFSYSAFNLEALTNLAAIVASTGIDLYAPVKPGAPGILTGVDALMPFDKSHKWTHEQIGEGMEGSLCPALVRAAAKTGEKKYAEAQGRFACKATAISLLEGMSTK